MYTFKITFQLYDGGRKCYTVKAGSRDAAIDKARERARRAGSWEAVYATDFYKLDGFSYCVFQEVFNSSLPRWLLTFGKWDQGWPVDIARRYIHEDTEEDAKATGEELLEEYGAQYVEVLKVA